MTYSDNYKRGVLQRARRTVARVDATLQNGGSTPRFEDAVERWRAIGDDRILRRELETERRGLAQRQHEEMQDRLARTEQALREGLQAVDVLGEAIENRFEDMEAELNQLRAEVAEIRLQRALDSMGQVP